MGLAPIVVADLFEKVEALRAQGRTVVLVEQYLTYALGLADLCYVLHKGRIAWQGDPGELQSSKAATALLGPV
jgi:branched-chain amino acid transport system ATP-binding protein